MKKYILLVAFASLIVLFQNCASEVAFKEVTTNLSSEAPPILDTASESFKVSFSSQSAPLDMIWVIDNSGSMGQEAEHVRNNLTSFVNELNKSTNFRFLLVSRKGTSGTTVSLNSGLNPSSHLQIDVNVGSTNGPDLLLNALGNEPTKSFLRQESKKIIVFVTDDNSSKSANFIINSLTQKLNASLQDISVNSFIALSQQESPCLAKEGQVYKDLASATAGSTYNICSTDWTSHFSDLIDVSVSKAIRRFTLTKNVNAVHDVKVDGKTLDKSAYSIAGKVLTLHDDVLVYEHSVVTVNYAF